MIMKNTKFEKGLTEEIINLLLRVGHKIEGEAKIRCPVETGLLRSSITTQKDGDTVIVGSNVEYAPDVELLYDLPPRKMWKAKKMRGGQEATTLPFLRPAMLKAKQFLKEECSKK